MITAALVVAASVSVGARAQSGDPVPASPADGSVQSGVASQDFSDADVVSDFDEGRELRELRTATTRTFATGTPGLLATEVFDEPVHVERPDGSWRQIDTDLVPAAGGGGFRTAATSTRVRIGASADADTLTSVSVGGGQSVALALRGASPVPAAVVGPEATFAGAVPGVDVHLAATPTGVKETLVLASPAATRSFDFDLRAPGLVATVAETGAVELRAEDDPDGPVRLVIPPGFMVADDGERSEGVTYDLTDDGQGGQVLGVGLDEGWLDAPDRAYPVAVDPTVMVPSEAEDTYVVDGESPVVDHSSETTLEVGDDGVAARRALLRFELDGTDLDVEGVDVHFADLVLDLQDAATCPGFAPLELYGAPSAWDGPTEDWPGPDLTSVDPLLPGIHSWPLVGDCPAGEVRGQVTPLVQEWLDTPASNHGIVLKAENEADVDQWWEFSSADASSGQPHLEVFWTVPAEFGPNTPEALSPSGELGSLNPTFMSRYVHSEGLPGSLTFALRLADTDIVLGYGTFSDPLGAPVELPSGTRGAVVVTKGLPPELEYEWRVFAFNVDGEDTLFSDASEWATFSTPPDPGCAGTPDPNEQDDTRSVATPLPVEAVPVGIEGLICSDPDVYRFELADGNSAIAVLAIDGAADLDMAVYDEAGDLIERLDGTGPEEQRLVHGPGEFFVEIYGYRGASGSYTVSAEVAS